MTEKALIDRLSNTAFTPTAKDLAEAIQALRAGERREREMYEALDRCTRALTRAKPHIADDDVQSVVDACCNEMRRAMRIADGQPVPALKGSTGEPFMAIEGRSDTYQQGYRAAVKDAITWLHQRAASMNDPHAVAILNSAAFNMGVDAKCAAFSKAGASHD